VTDAERRAALEEVAAEIRACRRCRLHETRTQAVPGEGHPDTEVLFVGEGPGLNEDRQGRPFVGPAGALLDELLASIGWRREEVFITNVVKCRPPGNRDPEPDEIAACAPFLRRQVEILDPALVVTLGRHSMARFMPGAKIGAAHGTVRPAPPESGAGGALVFAMYHPAAALHQGSLRPTLEADVLRIPAALIEARRRRLGLDPAGGPSRTAEATAAPGPAEPVAGATGPVDLDEGPASPAVVAPADGGRPPTDGLEALAGDGSTAPAAPAATTPGPAPAASGDSAAEAATTEADRDQLTLFSPA
jgi:DNA polymerase